MDLPGADPQASGARVSRRPTDSGRRASSDSGTRSGAGVGRAASGAEPHAADGWRDPLLESGLVLGRVALITLVWLVVFLLAFLGYLTVPAILLLAFVATYGTVDLLRTRRRAATRRRDAAARMLRTPPAGPRDETT